MITLHINATLKEILLRTELYVLATEGIKVTLRNVKISRSQKNE